MDTLKNESRQLAAEKNAAYQEYRTVRKAMQEAVTVKHNIDHLLSLTGGPKNKGMER